MVGVREQLESGAGAEFRCEGFEEAEFGEVIAGALKEKHGNLHVEEVLGSVIRGAARGMQGESKEDQATDAGERRIGLGLGGHAATEGFASGEESETGCAASRLRDGAANGGMSSFRRIGSPAACLHVKELVTEGGNAALGEAFGNGCEKRVLHAGPCAMGEDEAGSRVRRDLQQTGDRAVLDWKRDALRDHGDLGFCLAFLA